MTQQEWRKRLKAAHLCRDCKKMDAYTLNGRTRCAECAAKHAAQEGRRADYKDKWQERKELQWYRRAAGLCYRCGGVITDQRYATCLRCRVKARQSKERTAIRKMWTTT